MRNENNDKRGEKTALFAGIGAALGTGVGVAFASSLGVFAIAVLAVLGAVAGMGVGHIRRKNS